MFPKIGNFGASQEDTGIFSRFWQILFIYTARYFVFKAFVIDLQWKGFIKPKRDLVITIQS